MKRGFSIAVIRHNIAFLQSSGHAKNNAEQIAYQAARAAFVKRHPTKIVPTYLFYEQTYVPSKSRRVKKNPSPSRKVKIARAMTLYRKFSGHRAEIVEKVEQPPIYDVGIVIGELEGVAYETVRDGVTEKYFHRFAKKARPLLVSSFDGKSISIVGGQYDFTEDGIVDRK